MTLKYIFANNFNIYYQISFKFSIGIALDIIKFVMNNEVKISRYNMRVLAYLKKLKVEKLKIEKLLKKFIIRFYYKSRGLLEVL